ncbi:MAG: hypothetical protein IJ636_05855, partial [Bacteroidales bacterium]|nr:hypothetical protein [Bacteroidales bacterium]
MRRVSILLGILLLAAVSCYREEPAVAHLRVQLVLSDTSVPVDLTQLEVRLQNKNADFSYTGHPDASGAVQFDVQPGKYDVVASAWFKSTRIAVNGASDEFILMDFLDLEIALNVAVPNPLI